MIRAVLFDVDDTLYDQLTPFGAACKAFPTLQNLDMQELYNARSRRGMEALERMNARECTLEENHIYRMQMACRDLGQDISPSDALAFQGAYEAEQARISVTDGMAQVLDFCSQQGWRLGVITNGPSDHQRKKCRVLGLEQWIPDSHIFVSGDCGILKPGLGIFRLAQETLELEPEATLYVGDSYGHDILGAMGAGWQSFWLNRRNRPLPTGDKIPDGTGDEAALLAFLDAQS